MHQAFEDDFLSDEPWSKKRVTFEEASFDNRTIKEKDVRLSKFTRCGFKNASVQDCNFSHGQFYGCYFRKANFKHTKLNGCEFHDCRFDDAVFYSCDLDNAEFTNCSIAYNQIAGCLAQQHHNNRWRLARNLRINAQNRGDAADARKFLLAELESSEIHNFKKAFDWSDPYYGRKYRAGDRVAAAREWVALKASRYLWGYGELPSRVLLIGVILTAFFAMLYAWPATSFSNFSTPQQFYRYLALSVAILTGTAYGNVVASNGLAQALSTSERLLGLMLFGFFVATLYRRITRR